MLPLNEIMKHTSSLTLLYIENDYESSEKTLPLLEEFFGQIIIARDGNEGLEKYRSSTIDLIITDICTPHMDGLSLAEIIRNENKDIQIIILSEFVKSEYFMRCIKVGANGFLVKPIAFESLLEVLQNIIASIVLEVQKIKYQKLKEKDHKYLQSIIDSIQEPMMVIREDFSVEFMNSKLEIQIEKAVIQVQNSPKCYELLHNLSKPCCQYNMPCPLQEVVQSGIPKTVAHQVKDKNGAVRHIELVATPLVNPESDEKSIVETIRDVTDNTRMAEELKEQRDILHHLAYHDSLTGLANRVLFEKKLAQSTQQALKNQEKIALFFIDLDKFKVINDTLGHKAGDAVLRIIANRIENSLDKADTIARIGGDEFTVIVNSVNTKQKIGKLANKIIDIVEEPIVYHRRKLEVSASIGVSIFGEDTTQRLELVKYADDAMYSAKKSKSKVVYYGELSTSSSL